MMYAVRSKSSSRIWIVLSICCFAALIVLAIMKILPGLQYVNLIQANSVQNRAQIETVLDGAHIPWKLSGSLIEVPSDDQTKARIVVAISGKAKQGQIQYNSVAQN